MSTEMTDVRPPAVAGSFYPGDPAELTTTVRRLLAEAEPSPNPPKAMIVPHAGYVYSGPVAATAYATLRALRGTIRRVILIGPSHRVPLRSLAVPTAAAFATPSGSVPVDRAAIDEIARLPQVAVRDDAHEGEHSLEVHLPFLQEALGELSIVPIVAGHAAPDEIAEVLDALWGGSETLVIVSSDLSHYLEYGAAVSTDAETRDAIERLDASRLDPSRACGSACIAGLLVAARRRRMAVETLDLRNSGDTAGPRDAVVGYGAFSLR